MKFFAFFLFTFFIVNSIDAQTDVQKDDAQQTVKKKAKKKKKKKKVRIADIDLSHWKVTIPDGKPDEVAPPEILKYAEIEKLMPFMYNDSTDGSIVFHAYPAQTTANTKYSRTELREQMVPGSNSENWHFSDRAVLKCKMAMESVSKDNDGKYHRVIIAQIHGRLSNEQKDLLGQKDNNAPPILKVYWDKGKIRVKTKELKNLSVRSPEILHKDAWTDDKGRNFKEEVGFRNFILEVKVSDGKMVVSLNNSEFFVYENASIKRWDIFENYFKVGNYLQTRDKDAFAKVKLYELSVEHP